MCCVCDVVRVVLCVCFVVMCFVLCVLVNGASCAVVWFVWCNLFMLVCECLVWLCGVFVNGCVLLHAVCVDVCGLSCACGLCGVLRDVVWCVFCVCSFVRW